MAVDEEISIPANGKCSQSQASVTTFYSAASGSCTMDASLSQEPILMPIDNAKLAEESEKNTLASISKESMPELVDVGPPNTTKVPVEEPRRRSITDENSMQDIDPLGLIAFDSPSRFTGIRPAASCAQLQTGLSLLDVDIMASPQSMAKYSQRDFDRLKAEFERRAERQAEFMQFEIQTLQERYDSSLQANNELRILMAEYENTMNQLLGTAQLCIQVCLYIFYRGKKAKV